MTRPASDAITDARRLLLDQTAPYRYADGDLLEYVNQALAAAARLRPDILLGSAWKPATMLNSTDPLPQQVSDWYFGAVVSFVVGMANLRDEQSSDENRAGLLLLRLQQTLQGQGV